MSPPGVASAMLRTADLLQAEFAARELGCWRWRIQDRRWIRM